MCQLLLTYLAVVYAHFVTLVQTGRRGAVADNKPTETAQHSLRHGQKHTLLIDINNYDVKSGLPGCAMLYSTRLHYPGCW